jgi:CRP-like cAMP-binding protein
MPIAKELMALEAVPFLRLLGTEALRVLAIGSEVKEVRDGQILFSKGDPADCGYVVVEGSFRVSNESGPDIIARPDSLLGELTLIVDMPRPGTVVAQEDSVVIRISRSLFQKVLESFPDAAGRLRDELAARTTRATGEIAAIGTRIAGLGER